MPARVTRNAIRLATAGDTGPTVHVQATGPDVTTTTNTTRAEPANDAIAQEVLVPEAPARIDDDATGNMQAEATTVTTPATATPRRRGRPRREPEPENLFDESMPLTDFSITVVKRGGHIPPVWLQMLGDFCKMFGGRASLSLERGGNAEHLHIQGVASFHCDPSTAAEKLKKKILEALNIKRGDGQKGCELKRMSMHARMGVRKPKKPRSPA